MRMATDEINLIKKLLASGMDLMQVHRATGVHVLEVFCVREALPRPRIPKSNIQNWPQEDLALLCERMLAGDRSAAIARQMPHRTRNSIISAQHRYGLVELIHGRKGKLGSLEVKQSHRARLRTLRAKAQELGIAGKPRPTLMGMKISKPEAKPSLEIVDIPDDSIPVAQRVPILVSKNGRLEANDALTNESCRWPLGSPQSPDFGFCGRPRIIGKPYCPVHDQRAFTPLPPRRRRASVAPTEPPVPTFADAEKETL